MKEGNEVVIQYAKHASIRNFKSNIFV